MGTLHVFPGVVNNSAEAFERLGFRLRHPTIELVLDLLGRMTRADQAGRHMNDEEATVVLRALEVFARVGHARPEHPSVGRAFDAIKRNVVDDRFRKELFGTFERLDLSDWAIRWVESQLGPRDDQYATLLTHIFLDHVIQDAAMLMLLPEDIDKLPRAALAATA